MREAEVDEFDTISATSLSWVVYFRLLLRFNVLGQQHSVASSFTTRISFSSYVLYVARDFTA